LLSRISLLGFVALAIIGWFIGLAEIEEVALLLGVLNLVVASAYIGKVIASPRISRYLERHHPEILGEFQTIVAASALDDLGAAAAAAE